MFLGVPNYQTYPNSPYFSGKTATFKILLRLTFNNKYVMIVW